MFDEQAHRKTVYVSLVCLVLTMMFSIYKVSQMPNPRTGLPAVAFPSVR